MSQTLDAPPESFKKARPKLISADWVLHALATGSGALVLIMLASLIVVLFMAAVPSIKAYGAQFLVSSDWRPNELEVAKKGPDGKIVMNSDGEVVTETIPPSFGALPVIYGTTVSSAMSLLFAVPLSLGAAIFLVRIAPAKLMAPVSFLIEFLAAVPSIAYGIWGLFVLVPFLQQHIEPTIAKVLGDIPWLQWMAVQHITIGQTHLTRTISATGRDMLCGSAVLAVMIIPIITAISRDILKQVPRAQVEGTVALGATWWQSSKEMLLFARAGLFGAIMLGLARAAGETMAVTMVIGNNNQIAFSPLAPAQTMSSLLATEFKEASTQIHHAALCEVALILLVMSLAFNIVARWLFVGKGSRAGAAF